MVFIPMMTPPPSAPSPRAQELGQRLALTVAEFQQKYPDLGAEEVRQAMEIASRQGDPGGAPARQVALVAVGAAAVVAGLGLYLWSARGGATGFPGIAVVLAAVLAIGVAAIARSRRE